MRPKRRGRTIGILGCSDGGSGRLRNKGPTACVKSRKDEGGERLVAEQPLMIHAAGLSVPLTHPVRNKGPFHFESHFN